jgi:hypothetical protein
VAYIGTLTSSELQLEPLEDAPPESPVILQPVMVAPLAVTAKLTVSSNPFAVYPVIVAVGCPSETTTCCAG